MAKYNLAPIARDAVTGVCRYGQHTYCLGWGSNIQDVSRDVEVIAFVCCCRCHLSEDRVLLVRCDREACTQTTAAGGVGQTTWKVAFGFMFCSWRCARIYAQLQEQTERREKQHGRDAT